jgi:hypothetical protein
MPGITHFVLNTISRTSSALESPSSGFVITGLSTDLQMGNTYTISITHTVDASICPDMNIRVWIDYNHDGQLNDPGETVVSVNHHMPGTYTTTFTVPTSPVSLITPGNTKLRVTVKMSDLGGHTLPTPCDDPADPFGYHGEMEDYTVNLIGVTGVDELSAGVSSFDVYPNPLNASSVIHYSLNKPSKVRLELFNYLGKKMIPMLSNEMEIAGEHEILLNSLNELSNGLYVLRLSVGDAILTKTIMVTSVN